MDKIDPELLISLVHNRPVLWDKSLEIHRVFVYRSSEWKDVCTILNPEFNEMPRKEKHIYVKTVMKKWSNVRDAWKKTVTEGKRKKFRPYVYHEQLKFLLKNFPNYTEDCTNTDPWVEKTIEDSDEACDSLLSVGSRSATRKKTHEPTERENSSNLIPFMEEKTVEAEDAHISFFKSLLPSLQKLDVDDTLEFQMGVIKLLQELRRKARDAANVSFQCYSVPSPSYQLPDIKKHFG